MVAIVSRQPKLTTFVVQGELGFDEVIVTYAHFLGRGASRLTLWDLSAATVGQMDAESIQRLAQMAALLGKDRRPQGKVAVVCGRPSDLEMARVLARQLSVEGYPARLAAFTDLNSAKTWLRDENRE
jgi:hypothetical protein